ncbi:MAG TPA: diguanylate cyclase [Chloroflexota bacterium]|nr:diguanylate cyclase [Chloroflexota bacterium]
MKVMVVEDGRTTRMMLKSAVEHLGHECLTAADGGEAWELFRAEGADVIISDWLMPGIEGPELCKLVRTYPGPYTYFVLLTAFGDRAHALEGMQAGADDYLTKPLDVDDLHLRLIAAERISALHKRLAEQDARLRSLAEFDQLTQLANRHKSTEVLTHFLALAHRETVPLSLVIVDIDHFKQVNDRFGHATGDEVLQRLGATLRRSFRDEDVVARWGGEEFVVGMYAIGTGDGVTRMYRALEAVRREIFTGPGGDDFHVTFSAGVAEFPNNGRDLQALYRSADEALYHAKDAGRARVFAAQDPPRLLRAAS